MTDQLHIAILSMHSCPYGKPGSRYTGGLNIYIQNLARELDKRGQIIDIFTCSHANDDQCKSIQLNDNVKLIHIKTEDYSHISEACIDQRVSEMAESILYYCFAYNLHYDLIHSHYWLSGMVGKMLKDTWGIPHVTMFHTLGTLKNKAGLGILEPQFRIRNERMVVKYSDLIIASTGTEKGELVDRYGACPADVAVIPCGVNSELFHPVDKPLARRICSLESKKTILFVGRADPLKGLDNLIEAMAMLGPRDDFQLLVIGGDGRDDAQLHHSLKLAGKYNFSSNVNFIGQIPHENMYLFYNAADFCIIPSYYESFSLVALESLACGTPIIATDVGEVKDISGLCPSCIILTDNNPQNLARHINFMLDSIGNSSNNMSNALAEKYGWHMIAEKILTSYQDIVSAIPEYQRAALRR